MAGTHAGYVLVVDDDPDIRDMFERVLVRRGYPARAVASAAEAIELMEGGERPSAVLADVLMPGIIGSSLADYLRSKTDLAAIPIAFVTGVPQLAPPGSTAFRKPVSVHDIVSFLDARGVTPTADS
jgi:two-component system, chemotaxis family, chemotaxis protein CheY